MAETRTPREDYEAHVAVGYPGGAFAPAESDRAIAFELWTLHAYDQARVGAHPFADIADIAEGFAARVQAGDTDLAEWTGVWRTYMGYILERMLHSRIGAFGPPSMFLDLGDYTRHKGTPISNGVRHMVTVLDGAPAELTPAERLVLVAIAENVNDDDPGRMTWPGFSRSILMRRTGLKEAGLRRAFERLASRGLECRVPLGADKNGAPLYAVPGKACRYRMPILTPAQGATQVAPSTVEGATTGPPAATQVAPAATPVAPFPSPLSPQKLASDTAPKTNRKPRTDRVDAVLAAANSPVNRATIAEYLTEQGKGLGVVAAAERDGTLPALLDAVRVWATPTHQPTPRPAPDPHAPALTTRPTNFRDLVHQVRPEWNTPTTRTHAQPDPRERTG